LWTFPGGTPSSSILESPFITYNNQGAYNVGLSVSNANGSSTLNQNNLVVVYPKPSNPVIVQIGNELNVSLQFGETATWFLNGEQLGNNQILIIDTSGFYYVDVTNSFGCTSQSDVLNVLNIENNSADNLITIFPNPNNGVFNIHLRNLDIENMLIIDALGRILLEIHPNEKILTVDLSHLSPGIYSVVVFSELGVANKKIEILD